MKGQQAIGTLIIFIGLIVTAAVATAVLIGATNTLSDRSSLLMQGTLRDSVAGLKVSAVDGWADAGIDGELNLVSVYLELQSGSDVVNLKDVKILWMANNGLEFQEYVVMDPATDVAIFNPANLGGATVNDVFTLQSTGAPIAAGDANAYIVPALTSHNDGASPDRYVETGELYALVFLTPATLTEGEQWSITLRGPYIQTVTVSDYAPSVIQNGSRVELK